MTWRDTSFFSGPALRAGAGWSSSSSSRQSSQTSQEGQIMSPLHSEHLLSEPSGQSFPQPPHRCITPPEARDAGGGRAAGLAGAGDARAAAGLVVLAAAVDAFAAPRLPA